MILAQGAGLLFPKVYLFLISSGGFALLFSYIVIMATHIRFRKKNGCPDGKCQLWGFPYTSVFVLGSLVGAILSMPFVKGQVSGLFAGILIVFVSCAGYVAMKHYKGQEENVRRKTRGLYVKGKTRMAAEISEDEVRERKTRKKRMKQGGRVSVR
jgi:L-asparagine transporter-like permease